MNFDAPDIPKVALRQPGEFAWATYISDRTPQFKVHRTVGHAHSALTNRLSYSGDWRTRRFVTANLALYHATGAGWEVTFAIKSGTTITHFPWQQAPPDPEIARRERALSNLNDYLRSAIQVVERELTGEERSKALEHLRAAKSIAYKADLT